MAMRQQQKGIQYEDLVPKSELKDQPEATLLTIDLPGFTKDQIKVTYVNSSKIIRVTGERPVADRRWSRFNEVFNVPQNCSVDNIHGSFKNNVLTITMPKEKITKMTNLPESSKTMADPMEEKRLLEESRRKEEKEEAEHKKKKVLEEKEELIRKLQEEAIAKEKAEMMKRQEEVKAKEKTSKRKLVEEAMAEARKLQEEVKAKEKASKRKLVEEATLEKVSKRKLVEEATLEKNSDKKSINEAGGEEKKLPVVYTKPEPFSGPKSESGGVSEMVKTAEEKLGYLVEKEIEMVKGIMEKIRGKEITSEEKKLMVNVGVASLVIFALGAYVSYTFCCSSTKPK